MRGILQHIAMMLLCVLFFASCDVHEFPEAPPTGVVLHLHHLQDMPLYKEIHYPQSRAEGIIPVRYTVWGWRIDERFASADNRGAITRMLADHTPDLVMEFSGLSLADPDTSRPLEGLKTGLWHFIVWTEGADPAGTGLAYDDTDPMNVTLRTDGGVFSSGAEADCFRGEVEAQVSKETMTVVEVEMERPVGAFQFVTTDLTKFLENESRRSGRAPNRVVDLNDYSVTFHVNGYFPTVFDNFVDKPVDAIAGLRTPGYIADLGSGQGDLGRCMMFTNGIESSVSIIVRISDRNGVIATSSPVDVPVKRGKLTRILGDFLTIDAGTSIGVITDFDGEYNYPVNVH